MHMLFIISVSWAFFSIYFLCRFCSGKQNNKPTRISTRKIAEFKTYDSGDNHINWSGDNNCFTNCHHIHNVQWFYLSKCKWELSLLWKGSSGQCLFWDQLMKDLKSQIHQLSYSKVIPLKLIWFYKDWLKVLYEYSDW